MGARNVTLALCGMLIFHGGIHSARADDGSTTKGTIILKPSNMETWMEGRTENRCLGDPSCRIVVGDSAAGWIEMYCVQNGKYIKDSVTMHIVGHPTTGGAKATFTPNPVLTNPPTDQQTKLTILTEEETKPGDYQLQIWAVGKKCPVFNTLYAQLRVAPKLSRTKDVVWWFNGEKPAGYTFNAPVTAKPTKDKEYTFIISSGKEYAEFSEGGSVALVNKNTVDVKAKTKKEEDLPKKKGDFQVTVKVNGIESDPVKMRVKRPYEVKFLRNVDEPDDDQGYQTIVRYSLLDQFGVALPKTVPIREHFTGPVRNYPANEDSNWNRGPEGGGQSEKPGEIKDTITGQHLLHVPPLEPKAQAPQKPLGKDAIQWWPGEVWIGSDQPGRGIRVMTLRWSKFRDHARHCKIESPPGTSLPSACPDGP